MRGDPGGPPVIGGIHADDDDLGRLVAHWRRLADHAATMRERVTRLAADSGVRAAQAVAAESVARSRDDLAEAQRVGISLANSLYADLRALSHSRDNYRRVDHEVAQAITEIGRGVGGAALDTAGRNVIRTVLDGGHTAPHTGHREPHQQPSHQPTPPHHDAPPRHPAPPHVTAMPPEPHPERGQRAVIIARARQWVDDGIAYNPNGSYDGYRTDCSGFVSMAWGLPESLTTNSLPDVSHRISADELRSGDVLLNTAPGMAGHVVLFDRWVGAGHTAYLGYELCPGGARFHVVPYPYFAGHGTFEPYRYDQLG